MLYYIILIILLLPNILCYDIYNSTVSTSTSTSKTDNIIIDFNNCKVIIPSLSNGAIFTFLYYVIYYYIKKNNQPNQISQDDQLNQDNIDI